MSNATKVTITIVVSVIVAFLGYRFMEDLPLFSGSKVIYTYYNKVDGLTSGGYIYINGVKVGSVKKIELEGRDSVKVALTFNAGVKVNKGSVASLQSTGLLGDKAIYIDKGASKEAVPDGGTIKGVYSNGMFETFKKKGSKLTKDASQSFDKLNKTLGQLQMIVDKKNRHKIDGMLRNLKQSSQQLSTLMQRKRKALGETIDHANRVMANLDSISTKNKTQIDSAFTHLNHTMANLQKISSSLKSTNEKLNSVLEKLDNGKGSLGKLVNDPSLYNHVDTLSVRMGQLIKNINDDPGKYLKGLKLIDIF